ncbi:MAG: LPS export ABC transporter periplasmic protein LptC [Betaproteobacteria bacterium]|nr:MAG: LPS export ABC transporter periplasmic protein LptC [Betaproteobacteria bacterium]
MTSRGQVWRDRLIAWSPVLLLGALAALTYWLNAQIQVAGPTFDGSDRHDADVFVDNFKALSLDSDGRIRQALVAKRARHFPDDDTIALDVPEVAFTDPGKPRLDVTADHARVTGDREHAYFEGHVKAVREATKDAAGKTDGPITFVSEYLHVIPKEDRVVTDRAVTITDPRGTINSTGLEFDNKAKTLKLKSRVSGQLQPQSKSP